MPLAKLHAFFCNYSMSQFLIEIEINFNMLFVEVNTCKVYQAKYQITVLS